MIYKFLSYCIVNSSVVDTLFTAFMKMMLIQSIQTVFGKGNYNSR